MHTYLNLLQIKLISYDFNFFIHSPPKAQAKTQEHGAFGSDMSGLDFIDKSNTNSIENLIDSPQLQESLHEMRVSDVP